MKLLVDLHSFDNHNREGITTYLEGIYGALITISPDVEFYMAAADVESIRAIFGVHRNVHYVSLRSRGGMYRLVVDIPALVRRYDIDYVHCQYIAPFIYNCKSIITLHDILFVDFPHYFPLSYRAIKGFLFRLSAHRADVLLTVSEYSRERISHHYNIPISDICVTPNAVSDDFASVDSRVAQEFITGQGVGRYVLYVSRFEPRKNHVALLRAYCHLRLWERGYDLVLIGCRALEVRAFDECLSAMSCECRRHVHVLCSVDSCELRYWYCGASLFVYPSLAEGFGIPPLEAVMAGVPCVCSRATAMGEYTFLGRNLVDVDDEEVFRGAILRNLERSSVVPRSSVLERYSWRRAAQMLRAQLCPYTVL